MEQVTNQSLITLFSEYVLNPAAINATDTAHLVSLSNKFPCCQILYAFISRSTYGGEADFDQRLSKAALYSPDRNILHTIVNRPDALLTVTMEEDLGLKPSDRKMPDIHSETKARIAERMTDTESSAIKEYSNIPTESGTEHQPKEDILDTSTEDSAEQQMPNIHAETKALIAERVAYTESLAIKEYSNIPTESSTEHQPKEDILDTSTEDSAEQQMPNIHAETKALIAERVAYTESLAIKEYSNIPTESSTENQPKEDILDTSTEDSAEQQIPGIHAETKARIAERMTDTESSAIKEYSNIPTEPSTEHDPKEDILDTSTEDSAEQQMPNIHAETKALIAERVAYTESLAIKEYSNIPTESSTENQPKEDILDTSTEDSAEQQIPGIHAETKARIAERMTDTESSAIKEYSNIPTEPSTEHDPKEGIIHTNPEDSAEQQMPDIHAEKKALIAERVAYTESLAIKEYSNIPTEPGSEHQPKEDIVNTNPEDSAEQQMPDIHAETKALIAERVAYTESLAIKEYSNIPTEPGTEHQPKEDILDTSKEDSAEQLTDVVERPTIIMEKQIDAHEDAMQEKALDCHEVSKYDDDKMPYSFLWWLNTTRKEHSTIFQPYLKLQSDVEGTKKHATEGLGHQIVENIFYQQSSPLRDLENQGLDVNHLTFKRKEESVLDKFIQEDPQIKPPKPENLSIENKARQSAQDLNDLVSETLAEIYTGQMLFDKAIDTYKKLSLKFPGKSAYFAELIDSLEKKLNK